MASRPDDKTSRSPCHYVQYRDTTGSSRLVKHAEDSDLKPIYCIFRVLARQKSIGRSGGDGFTTENSAQAKSRASKRSPLPSKAHSCYQWATLLRLPTTASGTASSPLPRLVHHRSLSAPPHSLLSPSTTSRPEVKCSPEAREHRFAVLGVPAAPRTDNRACRKWRYESPHGEATTGGAGGDTDGGGGDGEDGNRGGGDDGGDGNRWVKNGGWGDGGDGDGDDRNGADGHGSDAGNGQGWGWRKVLVGYSFFLLIISCRRRRVGPCIRKGKRG